MMHSPVNRIYIPGRGVVDLDMYRIHRAVSEYDDRLIFGRVIDGEHPLYGDYALFVKMPHGQKPVCVLTFGKQLPTPEEAVKRADAANTRKHGSEIYDAMLRDNAELEKARAAKWDDLGTLVSEVRDHAFRQTGVHPFPRIFVPKGV